MLGPPREQETIVLDKRKDRGTAEETVSSETFVGPGFGMWHRMDKAAKRGGALTLARKALNREAPARGMRSCLSPRAPSAAPTECG